MHPLNIRKIPSIAVEEDLLLRKIEKNDLAELFQTYSDPEVMKYTADPAFPGFDYMDQFYHSVMSGYRKKEYFELAIIYRSKPIGTCSFHSFNKEEQSIEIGYLLNRAFWGCGIATKVVNKLIDYLTKELAIKKIIADIEEENRRSINFIEKIGFTKVDRKKYILISK